MGVYKLIVEHRYRTYIVALISIIVAVQLLAPAYTGSSYSDVGIGKREPIPQTLPWYPLAVFGDNRPDRSGEVRYNGVTYVLRDELVTINPFAVIGVGDHVWNGYVDQIQHFIQTFKNVPNLWVVAGNHEWNNKPGVDDSNQEGITYWRQHVAPDLYYKDDIPGWRIVFINLRAGYNDWDSVRNWLVNDAFKTNRHLIVAFHEPVYPRRDASKAISRVQDKLIPLLNQYRPDIVLQGHIHCYDQGTRDGTLYIITGGGGAPKCKRYPYHYITLILKPNGEYWLEPIAVSNSDTGKPKIGDVKVLLSNKTNTTHIVLDYTIYNSKKNIYNEPAPIPLRINFEIKGEEYGIVYVAPYGTSEVEVTYSLNKGILHAEVKAPKHYDKFPPYIYGISGSVWVLKNYVADIQLEEPPANSETPAENTSTTTTTPLTTTQPHEATMPTNTQVTTTTSQSVPSSPENTSSSGDNVSRSVGISDEVLMAVAGVLVLIIAVEGVVLYRNKRS